MHHQLLRAALLCVLLLPGGLAAQAGTASPATRVRVEARILLLDRAELRRAGLDYVQVGGGRIALAGRSRGGVRADPGGISVSAFVQLARSRRVLRSESTLQVLTLSGSPASLSSGSVTMSGWGGARTEGPELLVTPTVLEDGSVRLEVRARLRDEARSVYGDRVDGSPVDVGTTVVVRAGEPATLGSARVQTETRDAGLLRWEDRSGSREVLVVLTPVVVPL